MSSAAGWPNEVVSTIYSVHFIHYNQVVWSVGRCLESGRKLSAGCCTPPVVHAAAEDCPRRPRAILRASTFVLQRWRLCARACQWPPAFFKRERYLQVRRGGRGQAAGATRISAFRGARVPVNAWLLEPGIQPADACKWRVGARLRPRVRANAWAKQQRCNGCTRFGVSSTVQYQVQYG